MRRRGRELALKLLFQIDVGGHKVEEVLALDRKPSRISEEAWDYAVHLVKGIVENWDAINNLMEEYTKEWGKVERLASVDRNILRIGIYELLHNEDVPVGVAISEAVRLAEIYGTEGSARFVNGVLSRISQRIRRNQGGTNP